MNRHLNPQLFPRVKYNVFTKYICKPRRQTLSYRFVDSKFILDPPVFSYFLCFICRLRLYMPPYPYPYPYTYPTPTPTHTIRPWVWTFAWFVILLLATILCIWEIWSPRIQCITLFPCWQKRKKKNRNKNASITAPILKRPMTRNRRLLFRPNVHLCSELL